MALGITDVQEVQHIGMQNSTREVLYTHGSHDGDDTAPVITRLVGGAWNPAVRQHIFGNPHFSGWQSLHGTHTYAANRGHNQQYRGQPIRLWDQGSYPASTPPNTYIPNPSQLAAGNVNSSLPGNGAQSQQGYSNWYMRYGGANG